MKDALVIEGGGLRGIHSSGVLDIFIKYNIFPQYVIGVSAGALNGVNYIAKQEGRSARVNLEYMNDSRYYNPLNVVRRKNVFDFNFMFDELSETIPFDYDTFNNSKQRFTVVATSVETGQPEYFEKGVCDDFTAACAASASFPLITRPTTVDGNEYLDGGITDPIPFKKAFEEGCEKVVIILTRHKGFRKPVLPIHEREAVKRFYKDKPELLEALLSSNEIYNKTLDEIDALEEEGKVFVIRPTNEIDISLLESDTDKLGYIYQQGLSDGRKNLFELAEYLGFSHRISAEDKGVSKYDIRDYTSAGQLLERVKKMNSFGKRLTGSKAHSDYIKWLKSKIRHMGLDVYSDPYFFNRWEEKSSSLVIRDDTDREIHISSVFPYSGETPDEGTTAEMTFVAEKHIDYLSVKDKIAVVQIDNMDFLPSDIAFDKRRSLPHDLDLPKYYSGPVATSFVNFPFLNAAKLGGARAVICVWKNLSDECVEGQYLPFILDYKGIPAVWVNGTDGEYVLEAAKEHKSATLTLTAEKETSAETETFYCILKGENRGEAVIINTHTDGTNCIEENGAIAMLSLIDCLKEKKLSRTHIFVFVTGHFRLPMFKSTLGGGVQATSKWLSSHPDLWDGKKGHIKAVAGVAVEHLGCMEWKDIDGKYASTGEIETEVVYTGNKIMDEIYYRALEGRKNVRTISLRGHNFLHFGEGQPLFNVRIPDISLVTAPYCLCVVSDNDEMDKFDPSLMLDQTQTFLNILTILDEMPKAAIGTCDQYSLLKVKNILKK
ncbi:MAG: patatin family protein [Clostridiales bacterium]|nr:patatin family protein [Clostridiales bacterium]